MANKKLTRIMAVAMTGILTAGMLAGCGSSSSSDSSSSGESASADASASSDSGDASSSTLANTTTSDYAGTSITIFNSKMEIQDQMETMAAAYSEATGVNVEAYYSSDTVAAHLSTRYASNEPYTISMVDAKDVYSLAEDHAVDLSDQDWVGDTNYAIAIDGKTYGFPVCVEARGVIYNADAIKNITGEDFDPTTVQTLDDFKTLLQTLVDGGMESPVGIMKEDWSLGAHYLAEVYEDRDDTDAFLEGLHDGSIDIADDEMFNELMDTFDVLKANNYAKDSAISAEREVTEQNLAEGTIAFMFGGNWDWSVLNAYEPSQNMGLMPVPLNTDTDYNTKLVGGGSKYFFIDSSENTTDDQRAAAKEFLDWLVNNPDGQSFLVNDCALVPAFSTNTLDVSDPLGKSVKSYADANNLTPNYNYMPDDHYSILGASMQKYLADQTDRAGLASEIDSYWQGATLSEH